MRCLDVIHELSAPTGQLEPALVADHLAHCPSCARWAERNAHLDQIWEATRPPELSAAAWDRMWANVSEALDQPRAAPPAFAPASAPVYPRSWRGSAVAAFALAQAAMILAGFGLAWYQAPTRRPPQPLGMAAAPLSPDAAGQPELKLPDFDISPDQLALISLDSQTVRDLPTDESPNAVNLPMFNAMESLASLQ